MPQVYDTDSHQVLRRHEWSRLSMPIGRMNPTCFALAISHLEKRISFSHEALHSTLQPHRSNLKSYKLVDPVEGHA